MSTQIVDSDKTILKAMRLGNDKEIYSLSNRFRNATLHRQQVRACNLIWALVNNGKLNSHASLAVIGGGAAGVTAAACALAAGIGAITVLEQSETLLPALKKSDRYVHPRIFDWPLDEKPVEYTDLVDLNWTADTASKIAEHLVEQWERRVVESKRTGSVINVVLNAREVKFESGRLNWEQADKTFASKFDVIILALGIGVDDFHGNGRGGYWDLDNLEKYNSRASNSEEVAIVGTGDGGIADFLRAKVDNFNHQKLFDVAVATVPPATRKRLVEIENAFDPLRTKVELMDQYEKLDYGSLLNAIQLRPRRVSLVGEEIFTYQSSAINRYLLGAVKSLGGLHIRPGRADVPSLKLGKLLVNDKPVEQSVHLVVRIGINPPSFPVGFPTPNQAVPLTTFEQELKVLHQPAWPDGWLAEGKSKPRLIQREAMTLIANIKEPFGEKILVELYRCIDLKKFSIDVVGSSSEQGFEDSVLGAISDNPGLLAIVPPYAMSHCSENLRTAIRQRDSRRRRTIFIENGLEDESFSCCHTLTLDHDACCRLLGLQVLKALPQNSLEVPKDSSRPFWLLAGPASSNSANARAHAYENFFRENGLSPELIRTEHLNDWRFETAQESCEALLKDSALPAAVICGNDTMALGVSGVIRELKLDSSQAHPLVVGFDGTPEACAVIDTGCSPLQMTLKIGPAAYVEKINRLISDEAFRLSRIVISPSPENLYVRK